MSILARLLPALLCLSPAAATPAQPAVAAGQARGGTLSVGDWGSVALGRLANGLRYAILPRRGSEPGVGLLVRIEGGFIAERRPGERGLAHLIEHLALISPTVDAPDDVRRFIRIALPLTFPAPSAGTTSWRETNYFLSTRSNSAADLEILLGLFRESLADLVFRPDLVDQQRADVMREMAERRPGNDVQAPYIRAVAPGSPTDVIEGQNSDDVATANIETIRGLYRRLYRPEHVMVVVVGPVDPARIVPLIERRFGSWQSAGPASARAPFPAFRPRAIRPISYSAAQGGRRIAMITVAMPTPRPGRTRRAEAERLLMDMIAVRAFNNIYSAVQPQSPPGDLGLFIDNADQGFRLFFAWDHFEPGEWRPALAGLSATACRLRTAGFTEREWEVAKRDVVADLERNVGDMARVPSVEIAKDLSHALADGRTLIPPDELLRTATAWFPRLDVARGRSWWRRQWRSGIQHIRVEAPEFATVQYPLSAVRAAADEAAPDARCRVRPELSAASGGGGR